MQSEMAVASITFRPCSSTCRYEMRSNRVAAGSHHRIGGVDAVDLGGLEDDVGLDFHGAQRGRRIGAEVGIAGAGAEDDDAALFEVPNGAPADERLGNGPHFDRRDDARDDVLLFERVLQGQGVDDRRQHAHVVGGRPVHAARARRDATKDVAAADDDGGLDTHALDFGDVLGDLGGDGRIDAVVLRAHERFAGEFQEDAFVGRSSRATVTGTDYSSERLRRSRLSRPLLTRPILDIASPTLSRRSA